MNNENKFWADIAAQLNPDWNLSPGRHLPTGSAVRAGFDAYVYLIDTSTAWVIAANVRSQDMRNAKAVMKQSKRSEHELMKSATGLIRNCADRQCGHESPEATDAMTGAVCALALTQTYQIALASNEGLAGHWLYVLYRLRDGTAIGRPALVRLGANGFMPVDVLQSLWRNIVEQDTRPGSSVARTISQGGGARLINASGGAYPDA